VRRAKIPGRRAADVSYPAWRDSVLRGLLDAVIDVLDPGPFMDEVDQRLFLAAYAKQQELEKPKSN